MAEIIYAFLLQLYYRMTSCRAHARGQLADRPQTSSATKAGEALVRSQTLVEQGSCSIIVVLSFQASLLGSPSGLAWITKESIHATVACLRYMPWSSARSDRAPYFRGGRVSPPFLDILGTIKKRQARTPTKKSFVRAHPKTKFSCKSVSGISLRLFACSTLNTLIVLGLPNTTSPRTKDSGEVNKKSYPYINTQTPNLFINSFIFLPLGARPEKHFSCTDFEKTDIQQVPKDCKSEFRFFYLHSISWASISPTPILSCKLRRRLL